MTGEPFDRADWPRLSEAFQGCFEGKGEVVTGDDEVSFSAPTVGTGLMLRRDGSSRSFMPLHGLEARWDRVVFDVDAAEVRIEGEGVTYTYRIPPALR